jgi:hypothetical protein
MYSGGEDDRKLHHVIPPGWNVDGRNAGAQ